MEAEEAWEAFKANAADSLQKSASLAGQIDTLSAQVQNIQTGVDRITKLLPQFMGDQSAIDAANEMAPPMPGMDDMMGGGMPGEDEGEMPEEAPEEDAEGEDEEEDTMPEDETKGSDEEVEKSDEDGETPVMENDDESLGDAMGVTGDEAEGPEEDLGEEDDDEDSFSLPPMGDEGADVKMDIQADVPPPAPDTTGPESEPQNGAYDDMGTPNEAYKEIIQMLIEAAIKASQGGRPDLLDGIAKSVEGIQAAYGSAAPFLDQVYGTDMFTKSFKDLAGDEDMEKCGSNAEGTVEKSVTGAEAPDDMMNKSTDTKMHDVEEEKGKESEAQDGPKLGPTSDITKSQTGLKSIRDMIDKGCSNAVVEDELEKDSLGDTLDTHIETGKKLHEAGVDDEGLENMSKSSDPNMPEVPENASEKSVTGTASENVPPGIDTGSEKSVTGTASKGTDPVIDPASESSLSKNGDTPTQSQECDGALVKGKTIMSMKDMLAKSAQGERYTMMPVDRPDAIASVGGDISTPTFGANDLLKSMGSKPESAKWKPGMTPEEVTRADWERYNLFKSRGLL